MIDPYPVSTCPPQTPRDLPPASLSGEATGGGSWGFAQAAPRSQVLGWWGELVRRWMGLIISWFPFQLLSFPWSWKLLEL